MTIWKRIAIFVFYFLIVVTTLFCFRPKETLLFSSIRRRFLLSWKNRTTLFRKRYNLIIKRKITVKGSWDIRTSRFRQSQHISSFPRKAISQTRSKNTHTHRQTNTAWSTTNKSDTENIAPKRSHPILLRCFLAHYVMKKQFLSCSDVIGFSDILRNIAH